MSIWRSRNFWRLFGTYGLLVLCAVGVLGTIVISRVEHYFLRQTEESLRAKAILIREAVRDRPETTIPSLQKRIEVVRGEIAARITLLAEDGTVLAESEIDPSLYPIENHAARPEVLAARQQGIGVSRQRHSSTVDRDMMYVALRTEPGSGPVAFVRVALALDQIQAQLSELQRIIWTTAGLTGAAALALAFWLARRNARPLQELTHGAERIARGEYQHKVYAVGRDEIGTLGRAFNHMSEQLSAQFAQLHADRQQLQTILGSMVEGVVALDAGHALLFANDRASRLLEFDRAAAVGRKFWELVRQRSLQDIVRRVANGPETESAELDWSGPVVKNLTVQAARLSGSATGGVVLVLHDTSELRRLERLRQEFVANVSHELKTPLAVIKASVETLLDGAADDPHFRKTFLQQVGEQAEHLHALILDLLTLGRVESGAEAFELGPVSLREASLACVERHRARAESRNQRLEAVDSELLSSSQSLPSGGRESPENSQPGIDVTAWADAEAVNHILDNLVDNALKYTPEGGRIQVRWHIQDGHVCLEVEDNGIGIPQSDLPRIFERFYRVDKARSRELGGTGLGLSIVKHLVQALHGSIHAESQPGRGTRFQVWLPRPADSV